MTPPNYFRFVKKEDAGGGGLPNQEYRHRLANVTGLTEFNRFGGSSGWTHDTGTINSVTDVPFIEVPNNSHYFYFEIDDNTAIDTTLNSSAFTVTLWWTTKDGNYYANRFGIESGGISLSNSGTNYVTKYSGQTASNIATFTANVFHHIAYVVDKTAQTIKLYIDGTLEETINLTSGQVDDMDHTNGNHVRLFHDNQSTMFARPGQEDKMADFRLFSAALSASEISDVMDDVGSS